MTGNSAGETVPGPPPPDILLAALESSPSSARVAQLRQDVASVHGYPLDAEVEPLPGVRFEDEAQGSVGP